MSDDAMRRWEADPNRTLATRPRCASAKPAKGARKTERRQEDRKFKQSRSAVRAEIFRLDGGRCRRCTVKLWLRPSDAPHELRIGHVNEFVKRSLGGDPLDKCNCILLCATCHDLVDDLKVLIVALDETRIMRGPVEFVKGPAA